MSQALITPKYYWELSTFRQSDSLIYKEMKSQEKIELYVFKAHHPEIVLKLLNPIEKIQGWAFTDLELLERRNNNHLVSHWKSTLIPFRGQLILSILPDFNQKLNLEIEDSVQKIRQGLRSWMEAEIVDVFSIRKRSGEDFGSEHAFMEVRALYRNRYINYFQMRAWRAASTWEGLLEMAKSENITKSVSYGDQLQEINHFVMSFQVVREQKYQNMFQLYSKKKRSKKVVPKDEYQKNYQNQIMKKYKLYEYIQDE